MTVRQTLATATTALARVGPTPRLDAELLMAHALGIPRNAMIMAHLDDAVPDTFAPLLARRLAHEPVAHLTGLRGFWTIDLEVGPGAFIPRPDTETLIEAAVAHFGDRSPATILDLGTGPGTLLLAALDQWPDATGLGVERSDAARAYALRNTARLGFGDRAEITGGNWADGIDRQFDLVLSNPPYVAEDEGLPREVLDYEPAEALFGGPDGLDPYRVLAGELPRLIAPGGVACVEIGWTQAATVAALFTAHGLNVACRSDLGGRDRCIVATLR
ncbi:peptide chain release factor N(5)-glutamine methyltransferase [Sphingomonas sp. SUN039]|uniref:peptide chain release factor N(5)-glutamine methyltransferase n=1 Tax=Sphingomonas sp. SUN039 TaxID=2937787 RepID=UPI0021647776|nr:peptide chain release factor N(5)-glutamine methyltransferase [Sphingomonas sp. SUN039]UVO55574.1 peptide chain release factor N(5)-glutamine methyltransferase [Sphingomonas sp. SUN039]